MTTDTQTKDIQPSLHTDPALKIVIAGAGIAGLTTAIGLRLQGHDVVVLEKSGLNHEAGAALHLAPNSCGILHRMGLDLRARGSMEMWGMVQFRANGEMVSKVDSRTINRRMWQNSWELMHRAHLHSALVDRAREVGAVIHTRIEVQAVDAELGNITTKSGEVYEGDLIVGADGVHSKTRKAIPGGDLVPFDSGKSAFRCLIPMEDIAANPVTRELLENRQHFFIWVGSDRRVVAYPCADKMNMGVIVPSHLVQKPEGGESMAANWQHDGSKADMLSLFEGFDPRALALLSMANEDDLKVWTLLDMEKMPTFIHGRLALIGDAAHPFLPHNAQGASIAAEDGCSLAALLPAGTKLEDLPARLRLYEQARYERAHNVQEFTRQTGKDADPQNRQPEANFQERIAYNVGHDEWHASTALLQQHLAAEEKKQGVRWFDCVPFGKLPSPLQGSPSGTTSELRVRFHSSRTYLQTFLPTGLSFLSPATICEASLVCQTFTGLDWLGGAGYHSIRLEVHGLRYSPPTSDAEAPPTIGSFIVAIFEDSPESIAAARDEAGLVKFYSDISIDDTSVAEKVLVKMNWRGQEIFSMKVSNDANAKHSSTTEGPADAANAQPGVPQAFGAKGSFFARGTRPGTASSELTSGSILQSKIADEAGQTTRTYGDAEFKFSAQGQNTLPTLHGVVSAFAQVPNLGFIEARQVHRDEGDREFMWQTLG